MARSSPRDDGSGELLTPPDGPAGDGVSVARWFSFYGLAMALTALPLGMLLARQPWTWGQWLSQPLALFEQTDASVKLLVFWVYTTLATTLLPLPTNPLVAGMATREAALAAGLGWSPAGVALATAGMIAVVGATGSTVANLSDYHLFTLLLRSRRVARVRQSNAYQMAARWFARSPFLILVVFNIVPIPVDVIRLLAIGARYPRLPFAGANFAGRFLRYGVIAFVTYWWNLGWVAVAALLALAVAIWLYRLGVPALQRLAGR